MLRSFERKLLSLGLVSALALTIGTVGIAQAVDGVEAVATANPNDWPEYHRTGAAWRYSPLSQINTKNIGKLKIAWIHQPGDITGGLQATPIVVDGVLYYIGLIIECSRWTALLERRSGDTSQRSRR